MDFVTVNRTPVLTLWASVVAECLGFEPDEALTLGKAVVTAQSQSQPFGIFTPAPEAVREERAKKAKATGVLRVALLGRVVPVVRTDFGLRAMDKERKPMAPTSVQKYLQSMFRESLTEVRGAMEKLAQSYNPEALANNAFQLYEAFRPEIPDRTSGWGIKGKLSLTKIGQLAAQS
jgi:hypothetical protein